MSRLDQIQLLLASEPGDTFLRYALAMEYRSINDTVAAVGEFEKLMSDSVPHVPSFFMCGQLLAESGEIDRARGVLRKGIEQARLQSDPHAAGEMSEFLASLGSTGEY